MDARVEQVNPTDPRYRDLALRGNNRRFVGSPERIFMVRDNRGVVDALDETVGAGKKLAVRSGGHCIEGFVDDPAIQCVIDLAPMDSVYYDSDRRAIAVQAGATFARLYRELDMGWGVTVPGSTCPSVGVGGHVIGAGFGALSRLHGCISDHLYAVEVVVVGPDGKARPVIATREEGDPYRDLWWAHTGGGGGNFGVATTFWFRSPNAEGDDPARLLPKRPSGYTVVSESWNWADLDEAGFSTLVGNFTGWCERNRAPDSPAASVWGTVVAFRKEFGAVMLIGQIDPGRPGSREALDGYFTEVAAGLPPGTTTIREDESWLYNTVNIPDTSDALGLPAALLRSKTKGAYLRSHLDPDQLETAFDYLTGDDYGWRGGIMALATWGGQINAVRPRDTANPHRDSIALLSVASFWDDPAADGKHLNWVRTFYRDLFATTGGVPVPGERTSGCYINWPDVDLRDEVWNRSGIPWSELYYGCNYPKLREVKRRWDPNGIFAHALSIEPGPA
ncbi:MAG: FAD-binding oxidoreductase [Nocardia sp.]|nr:FAD-binding oxidoreductase [Nocardia sp.]